jgi:hypothetical protein
VYNNVSLWYRTAPTDRSACPLQVVPILPTGGSANNGLSIISLEQLLQTCVVSYAIYILLKTLNVIGL